MRGPGNGLVDVGKLASVFLAPLPDGVWCVGGGHSEFR